MRCVKNPSTWFCAFVCVFCVLTFVWCVWPCFGIDTGGPGHLCARAAGGCVNRLTKGPKHQFRFSPGDAAVCRQLDSRAAAAMTVAQVILCCPSLASSVRAWRDFPASFFWMTSAANTSPQRHARTQSSCSVPPFRPNHPPPLPPTTPHLPPPNPTRSLSSRSGHRSPASAPPASATRTAERPTAAAGAATATGGAVQAVAREESTAARTARRGARDAGAACRPSQRTRCTLRASRRRRRRTTSAPRCVVVLQYVWAFLFSFFPPIL